MVRRNKIINEIINHAPGATIRMYPAPNCPRHTRRHRTMLMRAGLHASDMAFQRFSGRRQDLALATDDAYASSTSPLSTAAWAQAPSQMSEHTPPSVGTASGR
jgi:hypothetical protein